MSFNSEFAKRINNNFLPKALHSNLTSKYNEFCGIKIFEHDIEYTDIKYIIACKLLIGDTYAYCVNHFSYLKDQDIYGPICLNIDKSLQTFNNFNDYIYDIDFLTSLFSTKALFESNMVVEQHLFADNVHEMIKSNKTPLEVIQYLS